MLYLLVSDTNVEGLTQWLVVSVHHQYVVSKGTYGDMKKLHGSLNMPNNLTKLVKALGWQGGTIHQVLDELNQRLPTAPYYLDDILDADDHKLGQIIYLLSKNLGRRDEN